MIRKLRKKLIAVSMISLCIVLFCIFGFVGILNYQKVISDADHTLSILADNDGTFPEPKDEPNPDGKAPDAKDSLQPDPKQSSGNPKDSPELPFESRYFSVLLDSDDASVLSADTGMIAAVDEDTAAEYATSIFESGKTKGFLSLRSFIS